MVGVSARVQLLESVFFFFGTFVDLLSDLVQRVACKPTYGVFPQHIFAHCAAALVSVVVRLVV